MGDTTLDPSEVASILKPTSKVATTSILDNSKREEVTSTKISSNNADKVSSNVSPIVATETPVRKVRRASTSSERAYDSVVIQLDKFKNSPYGSKTKAESLQKIVEIVLKYPKKIILDTILEFFTEHKDAEFLDEYHALQGMLNIEPAMSVKIRLFYTIMIGLARNTASRKNVSIEMVKNIFQREDLNVWLTMRLRKK